MVLAILSVFRFCARRAQKRNTKEDEVPLRKIKSGLLRKSCYLYVSQADSANLKLCSWRRYNSEVTAILAVAQARLVELEADSLLNMVVTQLYWRERLERVFPAVILNLKATVAGSGYRQFQRAQVAHIPGEIVAYAEEQRSTGRRGQEHRLAG